MRFATVLTALLLSATPVFAADAPESAFDRVMATRTINCGYILYEPVVMKDPNTGAMSGVIVDVMNEIARRIGAKVEWTVESSYATYSEDIKKPNVDLLCSTFWGGVEVGQFGTTAVPLWYSGLGIFVRADDTRFDKDFKLLDDPTVTVFSVDGTIPAEIARAEFPQAKILSAPAMSDYALNLQSVADGKADVTFVEVSQAKAFLRNNPGKLKNLVESRPLRTYPNSVMVRQGDVEMLHFINMALIELQGDGFIDKLLDKYDAAPKSLYRVAKPYEVQ